MTLRTLWIGIILAFSSCQQDEAVRNDLFMAGRATGINTNENLEEASGLAASVRYPGFLWSHNDSGHPAELFLLDSTARTRATFRIAGVRNRDWEDIAMGPGRDSTFYVYIGDIGDNYARHKVKKIYCVAEPSLDEDSQLPVVDTLIIKMSDRPRDTEALMVDPKSRNLYLITKREKHVHLYEVLFPFTIDTLTATRLQELPMHQVVAADISSDGMEILMKTYDRIFYWKRSPQQTIPEALMKNPVELPYDREGMGESIAWRRDGSGFYTLGENAKGRRAEMNFYSRIQQQDTVVNHQ